MPQEEHPCTPCTMYDVRIVEYLRGPNRNTRNYEDENAYNKPPPAAPSSVSNRFNTGKRYPLGQIQQILHGNAAEQCSRQGNRQNQQRSHATASSAAKSTRAPQRKRDNSNEVSSGQDRDRQTSEGDSGQDQQQSRNMSSAPQDQSQKRGKGLTTWARQLRKNMTPQYSPPKQQPERGSTSSQQYVRPDDTTSGGSDSCDNIQSQNFTSSGTTSGTSYSQSQNVDEPSILSSLESEFASKINLDACQQEAAATSSSAESAGPSLQQYNNWSQLRGGASDYNQQAQLMAAQPIPGQLPPQMTSLSSPHQQVQMPVTTTDTHIPQAVTSAQAQYLQQPQPIYVQAGPFPDPPQYNIQTANFVTAPLPQFLTAQGPHLPPPPPPPQIINYVPANHHQAQFISPPPQGYQGYPQQYQPVTPPMEMYQYQPQHTGIVYHSAQSG